MMHALAFPGFTPDPGLAADIQLRVLSLGAGVQSTTLALMAAQFGTEPKNVTAVLGPCIRPPDYDVDFAAEIGRQADRAGVGNFIDCGLNTASDLSRFYSYRKELGKTGRMMALIVRDFIP